MIRRKSPVGQQLEPPRSRRIIDLAAAMYGAMLLVALPWAAVRDLFGDWWTPSPGGPGVALAAGVTLGLAGVGLDRTELEIWADPTVTRNCHRIEVEADSVRFTLEIENVPSAANPRTGRLVANSVLATLRRLVDPLVIGT